MQEMQKKEWVKPKENGIRRDIESICERERETERNRETQIQRGEEIRLDGSVTKLT